MATKNRKSILKRANVIGIALVIMLFGTVVGVGAQGPSTQAAPAPGGPFNTAFRVQNLASTQANCVYTFYDSSGNPAYTSSSETIAAGDSLYVYVPSLSGLADGQYSAVVSCDQQVSAVANFSDSDSGASYLGITNGNVANTWYAPGVYNNYYNYYSDLYVQNVGSSPVDVYVSVYAPGSLTPAAVQSTKSVPANSSVSFEQEGLSGLSAGVAYSAKITATGNVATVANIYGGGGTSVAPQLYSYNPFSSGATSAYAPVIMNAYYGYNTSLTVQNLGTATTAYTVTYASGQVQTGNLASNSSVALYTPTSGVPAGTLTSAKVESSGQPIVALVNESTTKNRAASYTAFSSGTTTVRTPIVMRRYYKYNTSVTCQNIGTSNATITVAYGGVSGTEQFTNIAPSGTQLIYQPSSTLLSDNFIGSATITSDQPIACVVNEDMNEAPEKDQSMDQLYAYEGIGQ